MKKPFEMKHCIFTSTAGHDLVVGRFPVLETIRSLLSSYCILSFVSSSLPVIFLKENARI